ncbi:MAG: ECF transporter S component [Oscillospiraceae bacterium]|nr:ECF transporter S component [Oscillospiraceae bacterium]
MEKNSVNIRTLVIFALFVAIIGVLSVTPLGMIPLGFMNATTIHIPVIVGAIILGPKFGAALGGVFGLVSFLKASFSPMVTSFLFSPLIPVPGTGRGSLWALVIAFVPRILVGVVAYYAYAAVRRISRNEAVAMGIGAFLGSMTNTAFVMSLIYVIFRGAYAEVVELAGRTIGVFIGMTVVINGIPEAIVAVVISVAVCKVLKKMIKTETANA